MSERQFGLGLTWSRSYRETLPLLYGQVFSFPGRLGCPGHKSFAHFLAFTHTIPVEHLRLLRHLRLAINFGFSRPPGQTAYAHSFEGIQMWRRGCEKLKLMTGLSTLELRVSIRYRDGAVGKQFSFGLVDGMAAEEWIVKQLEGVTAKERCAMDLPNVTDLQGDIERQAGRS